MANGKKTAVIAAASGAGMAIAFLLCFHFGHHNIRLSRSYYLEKEIRQLKHLETHAPIDYSLAVAGYESLLARIRFDERKWDFTGEYRQALERAENKREIVRRLEEFRLTGDVEGLRRAKEIFESAPVRELTKHRGTGMFFRGEKLSEQWFRERLERVEALGAESVMAEFPGSGWRNYHHAFADAKAPSPVPLAVAAFIFGAGTAAGLRGFDRYWRRKEELGESI